MERATPRWGPGFGGCGQPGGDCSAIFTGAQFYFPDQDTAPTGDFPGPGDFDVNLNGVIDPKQPLVDDLGVSRTAIQFVQNDVRFMAHWGVDAYMRDWALVVAEARAIVGPQRSRAARWALTGNQLGDDLRRLRSRSRILP